MADSDESFGDDPAIDEFAEEFERHRRAIYERLSDYMDEAEIDEAFMAQLLIGMMISMRMTAYSLRHTYICLRLMEGADIYQNAKNCRTSVEMIEKYYASHIKTRLDAAAINVMRKRKPPIAAKRGKTGRRTRPVL